MCEKENVVLCGANSYKQKYYLNSQFSSLPKGIQEELKKICVYFVEEVGGILTMEFEPDGTLILRVQSDENDYLFDEIDSGLKIGRIQRERRDLLEGLEMYYRVMYSGVDGSQGGCGGAQ